MGLAFAKGRGLQEVLSLCLPLIITETGLCLTIQYVLLFYFLIFKKRTSNENQGKWRGGERQLLWPQVLCMEVMKPCTILLMCLSMDKGYEVGFSSLFWIMVLTCCGIVIDYFGINNRFLHV